MSPTRVANPMTIAGSGLVGTDGRVTMLRLPPQNTINRYIEYFYEGSVDVRRGVALVPAHKVEWIERLLNSGYILEDAADAPNERIASMNEATMESNGGYEFLESLGYGVSEPELTDESVEGSGSENEGSEPVAEETVEDDGVATDEELPA